MKNLIEYFYNFSNLELHRKMNEYDFSYNHEQYFFLPLTRTDDELIQIYEILRGRLFYDQLILNKEGALKTQTEKGFYVLIKKAKKQSIEKTIFSSRREFYFAHQYHHLNRTNWYDLWSQKIDYIEYQLSHIETKFPVISRSIQYYIAMTESAISYCNINIPFSSDQEHFITISHNRILQDNFNSPLNIIIDYRARDVSEYLKYIFFHEIFSYDEIFSFLKKLDLDALECKLIYARMFYPDFYFDVYDDIVRERAHEEDLVKIIKRNVEYEEYIKSIYMLLCEIKKIPKIDWV